MSKIDFEVSFKGETVTGFMNDDGEVKFHSIYDGSETEYLANPYRDTDILYLKSKEADYDALIETILSSKAVIEYHLEYWEGDCNRQVTIDNEFGTLEKFILTINPI